MVENLVDAKSDCGRLQVQVLALLLVDGNLEEALVRDVELESLDCGKWQTRKTMTMVVVEKVSEFAEGHKK